MTHRSRNDAHPGPGPTRRIDISRRDALVQGGAAVAGLALFRSEVAARLVPVSSQEVVIPWLDAPERPANSDVNTLDWTELDSWVTPTEDLFRVGHYGRPEISEAGWSLEVGGRVRNPVTLSLSEIRSRPRAEVVYTMECAGNRGFSSFIGAVHNARWGGTPLAPILEEAGVLEDGIEVVFFGHDEGEEEIRGVTVTQNFARSLSIEDAMDPALLLCYEVNGEPLPTAHGFPLRLIAPGWYGVANVKWLKRIEVRDRRFMGRFMGRDYVTLRQEEIGGEMVWTETSVGRTRINSIPAKVTLADGRYRIRGAAWGAAIAAVEVKIDDGAWQRAALGEGREDPHSWTFWELHWEATDGEHTITSRARDVDGNVQPVSTQLEMTSKQTYWESNSQVTRRIRI